MANKTTQKEQLTMKVMEKRVYDNEKTIVLFQNNQRTDLVKHPVLRGNLTLDGKIYNVSLWTKAFTDKDGKEVIYWKGEVQLPEETNEAPADKALAAITDVDQARALSAKK